MKTLELMNVNKFCVILLLIPFFCFSQKKDAYFLVDKDHSEYIIPNDLNKTEISNIINIYDREKYESRQKKIKEAKVNGTYEWNPESGRSNLGAPIFSFEFKVISKEKIQITHCESHDLNLVDYDWIKKHSWKPINREVYDVNFKDLYFLLKIKEDEYISYKVGITFTVH